MTLVILLVDLLTGQVLLEFGDGSGRLLVASVLLAKDRGRCEGLLELVAEYEQREAFNLQFCAFWVLCGDVGRKLHVAVDRILECLKVKVKAVRVHVAADVMVVSLFSVGLHPGFVRVLLPVGFVLFLDLSRLGLGINVSADARQELEQGDASLYGPLAFVNLLAVSMTLEVGHESDALHRTPKEVDNVNLHIRVMCNNIISLLETLPVVALGEVSPAAVPLEPHLCHLVHVELFFVHVLRKQQHRIVRLLDLASLEHVLRAVGVQVAVRQVEVASLLRQVDSCLRIASLLEDLGLMQVQLDDRRRM